MEITTKEIWRPYMDAETFERIEYYETVSKMWKHSLEQYKDKECITDQGVTYTYAQVEEEAAKLRTALVEADQTGKKGRVGILARNSFDFVKAYIAVVTSGRCAVLLPPHLNETSIYGCCMLYGISTLFYEPALSEKTAVAAAKKAAVLIPTDVSKEKLTPMDETVNEEAECVIMFTGGTTGKSKGVLLSNRAVMQGTTNSCYGIKAVFDQRYILILPLTHVFGLIRNLMACLNTGSSMLINRNKKDMFKDIAMYRPTILVAVPALAEMALKLSKRFGRNMLGEDMTTIICGAATVPPYLTTQYEKMGIILLPGYGLTESANLVAGNPDPFNHPGAVGLLYPNQQYRIENGELQLKGLNMMDGYVGVDENPYTEDGWFRTGDLVRLDDDGFMYITGRIKEIILLDNGENVSPAEVEAHFNELDCIQDSQVFEDMNNVGKHFLALEVVPREDELTKIQPENKEEYIMEELRKVNETLPSFQQVSKITIRTQDFERTPAMKIVRYHKC